MQHEEAFCPVDKLEKNKKPDVPLENQQEQKKKTYGPMLDDLKCLNQGQRCPEEED